VAVKKKTGLKEAPLAGGIRALREILGETQEGMARRLDVSLSGYKFWESGDRTPRGESLQKLLAVCPDAPSRRALFGLEPAAEEAPRARGPKRAALSQEETARMRARNTAATAIEILFELAEKGSEAAHQELLALADRASKRAGDLSQSKPARR
jgi:transcriptional regulator with XRE-family HTH domain